MFVVSIYRVFRLAWQGFWRNFWLSIITISIIVLAFVSVNFLIAINFLADSAVGYFQDRVDISIYFNPDTPEEKVLEAQNFLSSLGQVEEVVYVSQAQALESLRQEHQEDLEVIQTVEELDDNPLSAALIVKAKDIGDYSEIMKLLDNSKYSKELTVERNFENHKEFISEIKLMSDRINTFGVSVSVIFIVIAILIVFNTIRMATYTHREEIQIMQLVGANDSVVVLPFIIEGIMYAIIGSLVSISIIYPALNFLQPYLNEFFGTTVDLTEYFTSHFFMIFGIELGAMILLNVIFSWIAVRRYLKI